MDKKKIIYVILVVAAVAILALSNVWLFMGTENLHSQINSLESENSALLDANSNLQSVNGQLQTEISQLRTEKIDLETSKDNLESQINTLQTDKTNLQADKTNLQTEKTALEGQVSDLTNQVDDLMAPNLINLGLGAADSRTSEGQYALYVYGWICNIGREAAYIAKIHVTAYYITGELAIDTYIDTGGLGGASGKEIKSFIHYDGPALDMTRVSMILEWEDLY